jgi:hypothetical protein
MDQKKKRKKKSRRLVIKEIKESHLKGGWGDYPDSIL